MEEKENRLGTGESSAKAKKKIKRGIRIKLLTVEEGHAPQIQGGIVDHVTKQTIPPVGEGHYVTYESSWVLTDFWLPIIGIISVINLLCWFLWVVSSS